MLSAVWYPRQSLSHLAMGNVRSLGDKYFANGALAGLYAAFVIAIASGVLGDRTPTVYAPRIKSTFFLRAFLYGLVHSETALPPPSTTLVLVVFFLTIRVGGLFQASLERSGRDAAPRSAGAPPSHLSHERPGSPPSSGRGRAIRGLSPRHRPPVLYDRSPSRPSLSPHGEESRSRGVGRPCAAGRFASPLSASPRSGSSQTLDPIPDLFGNGLVHAASHQDSPHQLQLSVDH